MVEAPWQTIETAPLNVEVDTAIIDDGGERLVQSLIQKIRAPGCRPMWWAPDGSMYVYYAPTHWRPRAAIQGRT